MLAACKRYVWDTSSLVTISENPSIGINLSRKINPKNSFMYATSQSKADIQKIGMNFDNVLALTEKAVGGKIHYVEITPEIAKNAEFLIQNSPGLEFNNNFAYAHTTKSILLTADSDTKKICDKIGCKHFWSDDA